jgi:hypothetical protein
MPTARNFRMLAHFSSGDALTGRIDIFAPNRKNVSLSGISWQPHHSHHRVCTRGRGNRLYLAIPTSPQPALNHQTRHIGLVTHAQLVPMLTCTHSYCTNLCQKYWTLATSMDVDPGHARTSNYRQLLPLQQHRCIATQRRRHLSQHSL